MRGYEGGLPQELIIPPPVSFAELELKFVPLY